MCRMRIRVPEQWWGDYLAALGAARIGERELLALGAEVGWDALEHYAEDWFDYSERRMVEAIRRAARAAASRVTTAHDPFPGVPDGIRHGRRSRSTPRRRRSRSTCATTPTASPAAST